MCHFGKNDGPAIFSGAPDWWESPHFQAFFPGSQAAGFMIAFLLAGRKKEISCANGKDLRDNYFNIGGLAIWDRIGRMDRNDQFKAESIQAVSQPEYSLFRSFQIGHYTDRPSAVTKCHEGASNPLIH
jgi:hypothetical protein